MVLSVLFISLCVCVCAAYTSQLDDECADSGGVSVTDSVVNCPLSPESNLEQHSLKSLNLPLRPTPTHTHARAHAHTHAFPSECVPLVAGRPWFDRERLAPYHVYWSPCPGCFSRGGAEGFYKVVGAHTHTQSHPCYLCVFACVSLLC